MEQEWLPQWLKKQAHSIRKKASDVYPTFFPETIHQFRTETKALRAIIRLIHDDADDEPALPKTFRKLYRAAGAIRDRQMQLQHIATDKRHTLPAFAVWLAHKTGDAERAWNHRYGKSAMEGLKDYVEQLELHEPDVRALLRYYTSRLEKMKMLVVDNPDDNALHEVRKHAKDMQHVMNNVKDDWPEAWVLLEPLERGLKRLSDTAGAYNDRRNLVHALEQFRREYEGQLDEQEEAAVVRSTDDWRLAKISEHKALLLAIRQLTRKKVKLPTVRPAVAR